MSEPGIKQQARQVCADCFYDLSGLESDSACPECGGRVRASSRWNVFVHSKSCAELAVGVAVLTASIGIGVIVSTRCGTLADWVFLAAFSMLPLWIAVGTSMLMLGMVRRLTIMPIIAVISSACFLTWLNYVLFVTHYSTGLGAPIIGPFKPIVLGTLGVVCIQGLGAALFAAECAGRTARANRRDHRTPSR